MAHHPPKNAAPGAHHASSLLSRPSTTLTEDDARPVAWCRPGGICARHAGAVNTAVLPPSQPRQLIVLDEVKQMKRPCSAASGSLGGFRAHIDVLLTC